MKKLAIVLFLAAGLATFLYFGSGRLLQYVLDKRGLSRSLGEKASFLLPGDSACAPLQADGFFLYAKGFLARSESFELRAANLKTPCNLFELWQGNPVWHSLSISHLQAALGRTARERLHGDELANPEMIPPASAGKAFIPSVIAVAQADCYWGNSPATAGGFRNAALAISPNEHGATVEGSNGALQQSDWPIARLQQFKCDLAGPEIEIENANLTLGDSSAITVAGKVRREQPPVVDLQLTFSRCPVGLLLSEAQRRKVEGEFAGTAHVFTDAPPAETLHRNGTFAMTGAILKEVDLLQKIAALTGHPELAQLSATQITADYDWSDGALTVKNFVLEARDLGRLKGEFTVKENKIAGEFQIGLRPEIVEKFPGARAEIFQRSADGLLWSDLTVSGSTDDLHDSLRPRLVRAAQNQIARSVTTPLSEPVRKSLETIESL